MISSAFLYHKGRSEQSWDNWTQEVSNDNSRRCATNGSFDCHLLPLVCHADCLSANSGILLFSKNGPFISTNGHLNDSRLRIVLRSWISTGSSNLSLFFRWGSKRAARLKGRGDCWASSYRIVLAITNLKALDPLARLLPKLWLFDTPIGHSPRANSYSCRNQHDGTLWEKGPSLCRLPQ